MLTIRHGAKEDLGGRVRRIGCGLLVKEDEYGQRAYFNEGEAECRRGDITDPHAGKTRDTHKREKHSAWSRSRKTKDASDEKSVDVGFGNSRCDGETSNK